MEESEINQWMNEISQGGSKNRQGADERRTVSGEKSFFNPLKGKRIVVSVLVCSIWVLECV